MIPTAIGLLSLLIWVGLLASGFWRTDQRDTMVRRTDPARWPDVTAVVPARDEADVIARSVGSLAAQDYPGAFRVIVVDDNSRDDTATIVRALGSDRVTLLSGAPLASGWTGKLWAVSQG